MSSHKLKISNGTVKPQEWDFGVFGGGGGGGGQKCYFQNMVMRHIKSKRMISRTEYK